MHELLRLKGYSQEKDRQGLLVQEQNQVFERLLAKARNGELKKYPDDKSILEAFGAPVFEKNVVVEQVRYVVWMYRYSTQLIGSDKVYLYFDPQGNLKFYDFLPGGRLTLVH